MNETHKFIYLLVHPEKNSYKPRLRVIIAVFQKFTKIITIVFLKSSFSKLLKNIIYFSKII